MTISFLNAFRDKTVLVTGHTGFKGSWLCAWLHCLGARVAGYSLGVPTQPNHFEASNIGALLAEHHEADVRDRGHLERVIGELKPDVIFHMAAQALVRESYATPAETFDTNVMGTVNVLESARRLSRPCSVVVITSDKCYDPAHLPPGGHVESDAMGGRDPYSASKGAAELVVDAYRRSFFERSTVRVASVRAGNVIGGGDWAADRILADAARALARGEPLVVRNPDAVRPWQHVLEPLSGYLMLAEKLMSSHDPRWTTGWNFGPMPGDDVPVSRLADLFCAAWGGGSWKSAERAQTFKEESVLGLSIDKASHELGWRPRWRLERAVEETARWYKAYYTREAAMHDLTEKTIADYEGSNRG